MSTQTDKATRLLQWVAREHARQAAAAERRHDARLLEYLAPDRFATVPPVAVAVVERPPASTIVERGALVAVDARGTEVDFRTTRRTAIVAAEVEEARAFGPSGDRPGGLPSGAGGLHLVVRLDGEADTWTPPGRSWTLHLGARDGAVAARLAQALSDADGAHVLARAVGATTWHPLSAEIAGPAQARGVLPRPPLGCPARGLATLWFAAPELFPRVELHGLDRVPRDAHDGHLEIVWLVRDPALVRAAGPDLRPVVVLNAITLVNRVHHAEPLTIDATQPEQPLPLPEGMTLLSLRSVRRVGEEGAWHDCAPWLGVGHPRPGRASGVRPQYVVDVEPAPPGGREVVRLGLVDPRRPSQRRPLTHLDVSLALANRDLPAGLAGCEGRGDGGLVVRLLRDPSRCLLPPPAASDELASEALACAPLAAPGDATGHLLLWLERAAAMLLAAGPARERVRRHMAGLRRVSVASGTPIAGIAGIDVTIDLDASCYDDAPALFVGLLDQITAELAPPLAYARLRARFDRETILTCPPRLAGGSTLSRKPRRPR